MTEGLCPICRKAMQPYPMGEKNGYNLVACRACGSVVTEKPVTESERETFFGDIQPEIVHVPNPKGEIEALERTIKSLCPTGTASKRFLDPNCRNGYSVVAAKRLGMEAKGIDSHDFFIRFAEEKYPGHDVANMTLQAYAAAGAQAEFIFIREGFCEQTDLEGYTAALAKTLAPGGRIYIEEPDGNHFNVPRHFTSWNVVFPPMNFSYLSKKGMTALLARHGLKIQQSITPWWPPMLFFQPYMRLVVVKK